MPLVKATMYCQAQLRKWQECHFRTICPSLYFYCACACRGPFKIHVHCVSDGSWYG